MPAEVQQLQTAIAAFEAQRAVVGDAMVEMAIAPLRARLASLTSPPSSTSSIAAAHTAATAEPAPSAQALRQVSILFLDVVGSTTLASSSTRRRSAP